MSAKDSFLVVDPIVKEKFKKLGLTTPEAFLALPGEIVSGHPDRHVMRVKIGPQHYAYLKREHRVRWKHRLRSKFAGFQFVSRSVREAASLKRLHEGGFSMSRLFAYGETSDQRAFLLLDEVQGAVDLRHFFHEPKLLRELAERLGEYVALLHQAGVDVPDLCAKHVLVHKKTHQVTLIDLQRVKFHRHLPWLFRVRSLGLLAATCSSAPGYLRHMQTFLSAYFRTLKTFGPIEPKVIERVIRGSTKEMLTLLKRPGIREQAQFPLQKPQLLVWLDGEALCAIPETASILDSIEMKAALYDTTRHDKQFELPGHRAGWLRVGTGRSLFGRLGAWLRGKAWRSPELKYSRLLFHLERYHVPTLKLLAYGQRKSGSFVLTELPPDDAVPFRDAWAQIAPDDRSAVLTQLAKLLDQLHEAGCEAHAIERFALIVSERKIIVIDPAGLTFRKHLDPAQRIADRRKVAASMPEDCERESSPLLAESHS